MWKIPHSRILQHFSKSRTHPWQKWCVVTPAVAVAVCKLLITRKDSTKYLYERGLIPLKHL